MQRSLSLLDTLDKIGDVSHDAHLLFSEDDLLRWLLYNNWVNRIDYFLETLLILFQQIFRVCRILAAGPLEVLLVGVALAISLEIAFFLG